MTRHARLIIVAGLPGSGKTTLARKLENAFPAIRLSADDWMTSLRINLYAEPDRDRIEKLQWQLAQRLLELGNTVIVEWGAWGKGERDILRLRARELKATVELHYLTAPLEELYRRIQLRDMEDPPITWEAVQRWGSIIEPPSKEELALFDPHLFSFSEEPANAPHGKKSKPVF
jgi:predicted kinase